MSEFNYNGYFKSLPFLNRLMESTVEPNETPWSNYSKFEYNPLFSFGLKTARETPHSQSIDYNIRQSQYIFVPNNVQQVSDKVTYLPVLSVQPFRKKRTRRYEDLCFHLPDPVWYCDKCKEPEVNIDQLNHFAPFSNRSYDAPFSKVDSQFYDTYNKNGRTMSTNEVPIITKTLPQFKLQVKTVIPPSNQFFDKKERSTLQESVANQINDPCKFCLRADPWKIVNHTFRDTSGRIMCPKYKSIFLCSRF